MNTPREDLKFTVITVTYNAEDVLAKTIESVLKQKCRPYEYLVFDGKSTDKTLDIADRYKTLFQEKGIRFVIVSEKDTGIYNAMNKGINAATGDFISFLNAGDWYQEDALLNINNFYMASIECAIDADPRGRETVERELNNIENS